MAPHTYSEPLFCYLNSDAKDMFYRFADRLREPWDTRAEPEDAPDNRPVDPLLEN